MKQEEQVITKGETEHEAGRQIYPSLLTPYTFRVARLLLVATLVAVPWALGGVETWAWVGLGLAACLILVLWAVGSVQQRAIKLAWSPLYLPVAFFFLLGVVQYAGRLTLDRAETRQALVLLAADAAFFFLAIQLFSSATGATWRAFGLAVLVLAASLGLFALLQFASGEQRIYGHVDTPGNLLFGPYVNPNHFAGLMEMLIPVAVFCLLERRGRPSLAALAWIAVAAAIAVASLLLSGSRGGLLALAAEIVIAVPVVRAIRVRRIGKRSLAAAVAATILAGVVLFTWIDPGIVAQKLGMIVEVGGSAWVEWAGFRKSVASDSLRMLRDHPILGVGLGNFATAYPRYQSFPSDLWIDYAHNDYVQAMAETGLVGTVLIVSALGLFLYAAFGTSVGDQETGSGNLESEVQPESAISGQEREEEPPPPNPQLRIHGRWIRLGAALGCCGMLVHSIFDFNLHIPANAAWFAVLAGMACAPKVMQRHEEDVVDIG